LIIAIAGLAFGRESVNDHVAAEIASTFGPDTADQVKDMIAVAGESKKNSVWATILGAVTILIGATGVFAQFQKSLNVIWEVKTDEKKSGIWNVIKVRLFSFGLIVSIAFILIVSLVVSSILAALGDSVRGSSSDPLPFVLQTINFIVSLAVLSFLFALMFKFFPDAKIKWRNVWLGSVVTAILFELGKFALSLYFGKADPGSGYGAAGSIVLILLWVSYASMIVFYGAEFTHAYAEAREGEVVPDENAIKVEARSARI
jgi:membrane protein